MTGRKHDGSEKKVDECMLREIDCRPQENLAVGLFCLLIGNDKTVRFKAYRSCCESASASGLVPEVGLEPTLCCHKRILSPSRLPFRHSGRLEVPPGFEPGNRSFAGSCLTTWLWYRNADATFDLAVAYIIYQIVGENATV